MPIKLQYQVSGEELAKADQEKIEAGAKEPRLLDLLETMKQKRRQLTSLAERVQNLMLFQKDGLFYELQSQERDLQMAETRSILRGCHRHHVNVFRLSDWFGRSALVVAHMNPPASTKFIVCPAEEVHELNISICDPFDLTHETPIVAATNLGLNYAGVSKVGSADCLQVEAWQIVRIPGMTPYGSPDPMEDRSTKLSSGTNNTCSHLASCRACSSFTTQSTNRCPHWILPYQNWKVVSNFSGAAG